MRTTEDVVRTADFQAQWRECRDRTLAAVDRVGASGWLILGEEVAAFEGALARLWGLPEAIGCGNGLDALEIALRAAGVEEGERVLTTPLSAFATVLAILRAGAVPVFVDVDESGLLDLDLAAEALAADARIRCVLPVHLYGHAVDARRLETLRAEHGVLIVEDCAQSIGATSGGVPTGTVADACATSFYPTKNLGGMGDGGAVLTRDPDIASRARQLRDYGQSGKYEHRLIGLNSRLDELQAAIMLDARLPRLEDEIRRRKTIADHYVLGLRTREVNVLSQPVGSESAWHLFPVVVESARDSFRAHLHDRGIESGVHYPTVLPAQPALAKSGGTAVQGSFPRAEWIAAHEVSLPIHPHLSDDDVSRVVDACNSWPG